MFQAEMTSQGSRAMALADKPLLYKYEGQSLDPQSPNKNQVGVVDCLQSRSWEGGKGDAQSKGLLARLAKLQGQQEP